MKVGIHQPNFLPWMGYFYKISQSDAFILYDNAQYTKKSFIRRCKIHASHTIENDKYLIVPLQKHSDFEKISNLKLIEDQSWTKKIKALIHQSYHRAPYYSQLTSIMDTYFKPNIEDLQFSNLTTELILHICKLLHLDKTFYTMSTLEIHTKSTAANIDAVLKIGGTEYISGMGARKYQTEQQFVDKGIDLSYSDYPSYHKKMDLPSHMLNKSILAYLAYLPLDNLREYLSQ